jgi:hypothetical protein
VSKVSWRSSLPSKVRMRPGESKPAPSMSRRFWGWLGAPWSDGDRARETAEVNALKGEFAGRGVINTQGTRRRIRNLEESFRRRPLALRLTIAAVLVISASAIAAEYSSSRFPRAVIAAVTACAVPVALYLGLAKGSRLAGRNLHV